MTKNIRIECTETGHVEVMTRATFNKRFGRVEGKEILDGYCSIILAFQTDEPVGVLPNFIDDENQSPIIMLDGGRMVQLPRDIYDTLSATNNATQMKLIAELTFGPIYDQLSATNDVTQMKLIADLVFGPRGKENIAAHNAKFNITGDAQ